MNRAVLTNRRSRGLALVAAVVLFAIGTGRAVLGATPEEGTVSLRDTRTTWQGEHYAAGSTAAAHTTCQLPTNNLCDHFTLHVDIDPSHWDTYRGGVEVIVTWASAEDDFDLHVWDRATGDEVGHSIGVNTTSERVFIDNASGTYDVWVNPFEVTDSDYSGSATVHSRRSTPRDRGGVPTDPLFDVSCKGGFAGPFPCKGVDLKAFFPLSSIGGGEGNDIWGWTDPQTGRAYALMGKTSGMAIVDITVPDSPVYLGDLPSHQPAETIFNVWRDVKVYKDHAFVVAEEPLHGLQVFDLTRLRDVTESRTWTEDAHYPLFGGAHNVAINEETGFAYAVGSNTCSGGPHMVDIRDPKNPSFAGCVAEDGYTHDTQCVVYRGPDTRFTGREICFSSNEDTLTIVDVTDKASPVQLSRTPYDGAAYTHQGWLTEDQRHFLLGDELDEVEQGVNTTTYIFDVSSLTAPVVRGAHRASTEAIDHNLYVKGSRVYQANYRAGLRILDLSRVASGKLREVAFFDIYPADNRAEFNGAWSNYPFFGSGVVVVSGIEQGLFVLQPR
jgi:choice-of-anchor B domain-containing protein